MFCTVIGHSETLLTENILETKEVKKQEIVNIMRMNFIDLFQY